MSDREQNRELLLLDGLTEKLMAIIKCYECGAPVDGLAYSCANCRTTKVHGVNCCVCHETLKFSESVTDNEHYFHKACHTAVLQSFVPEPPVTVSCPNCRAKYEFQYALRFFRCFEQHPNDNFCGSIKCSKCGNYFNYPYVSDSDLPYTNCELCGLKLNKKHATTVYVAFPSSRPPYAHKVCAKGWEKYRKKQDSLKNDSCFIATAVYSTNIHPDLDTFRKFRDVYLLTNPFGKQLVSTYYIFGPKLAEWIASSPIIKRWLRKRLELIANRLRRLKSLI